MPWTMLFMIVNDHDFRQNIRENVHVFKELQKIFLIGKQDLVEFITDALFGYVNE